jgi:ribosomal protein L32
LPPNEKESKSKAEKKRAEWKLRAKSDLENEIIDLRKRTE